MAFVEVGERYNTVNKFFCEIAKGYNKTMSPLCDYFVISIKF